MTAAQLSVRVTASPTGGIGEIEAGGVRLFVAEPGVNVPEAVVTVLLPYDAHVAFREPRFGCSWRRLGDPPLAREDDA